MKNECPSLSILMPSLNVAGFIRECMDSVVNQTLKDIEIICIDAGSTDGTLEILREYEKQDQRIRLIISDKKSYGYQMNLGLDAANGEYIGIVETDDWVEPDMFENLWNTAHQNNVDIVKSNYFWYYTNPEIINKPFENLEKCPYNQVFSPQTVLTPLSTTPSIWSGIYRRSLLTSNNIRFNETPGASYQDTSFHFMVFTVAQSAYFLNKYYLHYRRDNETSSVNTSGKVYCVRDEMYYYEWFLDTYPDVKETHIKPYMALKYEKYRWNYTRIAPQYQWEFLAFLRKEFLLHKKKGLLEQSYFDAKAWADINEIIDNPVRYFKNTCKKYSTRPMGNDLPEADLLKQCVLDSPDVSIIIPAFNNEDCIARCLESAQCQTLRNIEIICVDDGSEDNTLKIILEHANKDRRITVLHQINQGQSAARNSALKVAKGRYIQFLDSDDTILQNAAEYLVSFADEKKLEILFFNGSSVYESKELEEKFPYYKTAYEFNPDQQKELTGKEYFCLAVEKKKYRVSPCMAIYQTENLVRNKISFIEGIVHEDNVFSLLTLLNSKRVWHISEQFYLRYVRVNSTMTSPKSFMHVYGYMTCFQAVLNMVRQLPYDKRLDNCISIILRGICSQLRSTYNAVPDKNNCRAKFTKVELVLLDEILKDKKLDNKNLDKIKHLEKELHDVKTGLSFRIGRVITFIPRKLLGKK